MTYPVSAGFARAILIAAVVFSRSVLAQWSADPTANLVVSDVGVLIVEPSLAPTSDGGFYVSWYVRPPNIDVGLQRLDAGGHALWAPGGIRIGDLTPAETEPRHFIAVDAVDNVYLAFVCDADPPARLRVALHKIRPDGTAAWGADGLTVAILAKIHSEDRPRVAVASDGGIVVAWTEGSDARVQKFNADGVAQWAPSGVLIGSNGYIEGLQPADNGSVIALWRMPADPPSPSKNMPVAQKLAGKNGAGLWNGGVPVRVFGQGRVANGSSLVADGRGGAVFWADMVGMGGPGNGPYFVRVQHLDGDGRPLLGTDGAAASAAQADGMSRGNSAAAFDVGDGSIYAVWPQSVASQEGGNGVNGVFAQRIDASGNRVWGEAGKTLIAPIPGLDFDREVPEVGALVLPGNGMLASWLTGDPAVFDHRVTVARLDAGGDYVWPSQAVDIRKDGFATFLVGARSRSGFAAYAWANSDLKGEPSWINVQDIGFDGALGLSPPDSVFSNGFEVR